MAQSRWSASPAGDLPGDVILFDDACGLCSTFARFVARRDRDRRYRFVAARSGLGQHILARFGVSRERPESHIVLHDGQALFKSDGALAVISSLPGWKWTRIGARAPKPLRDFIYDQVAANRDRLFAGREACKPEQAIVDRMLD